MKTLTLDEKQYTDVMNYLQELPFKMSNNLIVQLDGLFKEQNKEEEAKEDALPEWSKMERQTSK